jgi:hypothetical protein
LFAVSSEAAVQSPAEFKLVPRSQKAAGQQEIEAAIQFNYNLEKMIAKNEQI